MRNLSFALTTAQMRARSKTVTRRLGMFWLCLKPGELVCAVEKSQGIVKGGLVRLGVIRIVSVTTEPLLEIALGARVEAREEVDREGFPDLEPEEFVRMFCKHMRCAGGSTVTRIEFEHVSP